MEKQEFIFDFVFLIAMVV